MSGAELCERQFQSTPPARGRLEKILLRLKKTAISIHAPREGGATGEVELVAGMVLKFQSTPPRRGATRCSSDLRWVPQNFNPRPREGGRLEFHKNTSGATTISIHAPARGGDHHPQAARPGRPQISIHAPARGGDDKIAGPYDNILVFQSTPPRGGATDADGDTLTVVEISIHAPARGGDRSRRHRPGR